MDVRIMANAGYGVMVIGEDGLLGWCYQINICAFDNECNIDHDCDTPRICQKYTE